MSTVREKALAAAKAAMSAKIRSLGLDGQSMLCALGAVDDLATGIAAFEAAMLEGGEKMIARKPSSDALHVSMGDGPFSLSYRQDLWRAMWDASPPPKAEDRGMGETPKLGDVFEVIYPFVLENVDIIDDSTGKPFSTKSWRPGINVEFVDPYGETEAYAHANGKMVLTVHGFYKPGRFPSRVFFTRKFVDPEGHEFGKNGLKICTLGKFRRISSRYRVKHEIDVSGDAEDRLKRTASVRRFGI